MIMVTQVYHRIFDPVFAMNRRVSIGGGMLMLILIAESSAALIGSFG